MERLEIVHELTCINRNRRMLRQTLRSSQEPYRHDAPLSPNCHHCREQLRKQSCVTISVSVTVQIISPTSGCEKILWIKRGEGRAFQNWELACNPALNLTIAHSNYKKYQKILLDRHAMSSASCSEGSAPNQTVSSFLPQQIMLKLKAHENYSFLALTVVISLFVFNSVELYSVYFETFCFPLVHKLLFFLSV